MDSLVVEIRSLPPMRVVSSQAISASPERDAWARLEPWARTAGLFEDPASHPIFGFNNPPPEPGQSLYGYEFWIRVEGRPSLPEALELKEFPGGHYAVTPCRLCGDPRGSVQEVWQQLLDWVHRSPYSWRHTHELERLCNPGADEREMVLELFLPIEEE